MWHFFGQQWAAISLLSHVEILTAPSNISDAALKVRNEAVVAAQAQLGTNLIKQLAHGEKG